MVHHLPKQSMLYFRLSLDNLLCYCCSSSYTSGFFHVVILRTLVLLSCRFHMCLRTALHLPACQQSLHLSSQQQSNSVLHFLPNHPPPSPIAWLSSVTASHHLLSTKPPFPSVFKKLCVCVLHLCPPNRMIWPKMEPAGKWFCVEEPDYVIQTMKCLLE